MKNETEKFSVQRQRDLENEMVLENEYCNYETDEIIGAEIEILKIRYRKRKDKRQAFNKRKLL